MPDEFAIKGGNIITPHNPQGHLYQIRECQDSAGDLTAVEIEFSPKFLNARDVFFIVNHEKKKNFFWTGTNVNKEWAQKVSSELSQKILRSEDKYVVINQVNKKKKKKIEKFFFQGV
jgi:hypothetical protein